MSLYFGQMICDDHVIEFEKIGSIEEFMKLLLTNHTLERKCREAILYSPTAQTEIFHITGEELIAIQRMKEKTLEGI